MNALGLGAFHHVGVAVSDIQSAAGRLTTAYGAVPESEVFHDENQGVYVQFMKMAGLRIELIAPAAERSPLGSILRKGIALYHVCHEVDDLDATLERLTQAGATLVSPPKPAIAFQNRRVAFVVCERLQVEIVESEIAARRAE